MLKFYDLDNKNFIYLVEVFYYLLIFFYNNSKSLFYNADYNNYNNLNYQ